MMGIKRSAIAIGLFLALGGFAWASTEATSLASPDPADSPATPPAPAPSPAPSPGPSPDWEEIVSAPDLGGSERYLVYASTDKPIYREDETLYLRAVVLNAADNTPATEGDVVIALKIRGPKGDIVFHSHGRGTESTVGLAWTIPHGISGGQYTALVRSPSLGTPETERSFEIRAYRTVRLKTQIEFVREGYGPGDRVAASVSVERAEGGIPLGAKVTAVARVDGDEVFRESGCEISEDGMCSAEFLLPNVIKVGDGILSFIIEDGGVVETASKSIPILLQTLEISFYPEGGDLVAGLPGRVYLQANRPNGKPADIAGRIVELHEGEPTGSAAAALKTQHEGRGSFRFTPKAGVSYALVVDAPAGITTHFPLPSVKTRGAVLQSLESVYPYGVAISLSVASTLDSQAAIVTLHKREVAVDASPIAAGQTVAVELDAKDVEGVLIVTVWDAAGNPLAERLVYREARFAVNVEIRAGEGPFVPGSPIALELLTTDQHGNPVEAVVGLTVTDDAVLEMIETREQAPRLPVMVYLENEVRDLADAQFYLQRHADDGDSNAKQALDLLLGTQGWRRFILVRYEAIKAGFLEPGKRALAERLPLRLRPVPLFNAAAGLRIQNLVVDDAEAVGREEGIPPEALALADPALGFPRANAQKRVQLPDAPDAADAPVRLEEKRAGDVDRLRALGYICEADFIGDRGGWVSVREYAHQVRPNRKPNDRVDFSETLYWHAGIRTSARDGKARVEFGLADSVTSFRVLGDAFGRNGALGAGDLIIHSVEPFYIEPKMPLEVTVGDVIDLPVAMINATQDALAGVSLLVRGEGLRIGTVEPVSLAAGERGRRLVRIHADRAGVFSVTLSAAAGPYSDTVTRQLTVKPRGFPRSLDYGGLLGPKQAFGTELTIPAALEAGSLTAVAKVYPSPLANMEEALNALLRQPNGCFEQASSTNYPLVMAQQYFSSHVGIEPEKIAKARKLLAAGYKKLIGFESKQQGYEWFGGDPGHESLTAYGLMQFADMAKVMEVDHGMIARTRAWLLSRRDGAGGFKRNERALDSFGRAPPPTTNAYILWALLESGEDPHALELEIAAVKAEAMQSEDSYVIALAANILYLTRDKSAANTLSQRLAKAVEEDGAVGGSHTSITRSGGDALTIETTSLTLLAWLKDDVSWAAQVETSMRWLFERSKAGRFGSTQSTILALKAINAYDAARAKPREAGSVQLWVDGEPFGKPVRFGVDSKGAIELPDFSAALSPGRHRLGLAMEQGSEMPFALTIEFNTSLPVSSDASQLTLKSQLSASEVEEGESLEMEIVVTVGDDDAPTPIAIFGIPAGLELRHDQLKELVASKRVSAYEVIGRELVLYWRALRAGEKRVIPIQLTAAVPGRYTGPASRAYLYYSDEEKRWERGQSVTVVPRS